MLTVDPTHPNPDCIAHAADVLRAGGLVAFPTETVYGLGAHALDADAVQRIFIAKGRPSNNPLIVHVADVAEARLVTGEWPDTAERLTERFWPGPLTLVLPRRVNVPDAVTGGGSTVAVRVPVHPVARALLQAAQMPIAAPSANRSTHLSPTRAEHVLAGLRGRIELILEGGPCPGGLESTVVDLTTSPPRLLRPGLVTPAQIEEVVGPLLRSRPVTDETAPLPSPGMTARHYAPRAVLECVADDGSDRVAELRRQGVRVGWLALSSAAGQDVVVMPRTPTDYAARLYAALHELDAAGVERIVAALPPDDEEWLAVRDRLRRASTR